MFSTTNSTAQATAHHQPRLMTALWRTAHKLAAWQPACGMPCCVISAALKSMCRAFRSELSHQIIKHEIINSSHAFVHHQCHIVPSLHSLPTVATSNWQAIQLPVAAVDPTGFGILRAAELAQSVPPWATSAPQHTAYGLQLCSWHSATMQHYRAHCELQLNAPQHNMCCFLAYKATIVLCMAASAQPVP